MEVLNIVSPTKQELGIAKSLFKNEVKNMVEKGMTEEDIKDITSTEEWRHEFSQKVFEFQKMYF